MSMNNILWKKRRAELEFLQKEELQEPNHSIHIRFAREFRFDLEKITTDYYMNFFRVKLANIRQNAFS